MNKQYPKYYLKQSKQMYENCKIEAFSQMSSDFGPYYI